MKYTPLKGLIAAPFTAFKNDGGLNLPMIDKQVESLVTNGVTGAFVCGTTGEGLSLTTEERIKIADRWKKAAGTDLKVIVHVGHTGLADCQTLATHAQKIKADAIGCFAPCFFKPASVNDLVKFCADVARKAPETPFFYYHMPSMTGVDFPVVDVLKAASDKIPNLVGVKFTYENLMDFMQCMHLENGRFDMVFGRDEALLPALSLGAKSAIGSTYNLAAPIYLRLIKAFEKGDLATARVEQMRSIRLIQLLVSYGFFGAAKATMTMLGVDVGPTRLPNRTLDKKQTGQLAKDLEKLGFFKWIKA